MSSNLNRIVDIIRNGREATVLEDSLHLKATIRDELKTELELVHQTNTVRVFLNGKEVHEDFKDLPADQNIEVKIERIHAQSFHVSQNLNELISFQKGRFLCERPLFWYLIDEKYLSGEETKDHSVNSYNRLPALDSLLNDIADFSFMRETTKTYVILAGRRIDLPIICDITCISAIPTIAEIDGVREDILTRPQIKAKCELFKRAIANYLEPVAESLRFAAFVRGFESIVRSYEASRDNYFSEFEFEKLNESFERKRQEYMLKIDTVCGELLTKVLALPVAQAIVVSQYKDEGSAFSNVALLSGSAIVALLGVAFVSNQIHAIREIRENAKRERSEVKEKHPDLFKRIKKSYGSVLFRLSIYGRLLPAVVTLLIFVSFMLSLFGFNQVSPCNGCVFRSLHLVPM